MTLNTLRVPDAAATIKAVASLNKAQGVQMVATTVASPTFALGRGTGGLESFGAVGLSAG